MYRIAVDQGGSVHGFTLRLTPDIEDKARAQKARCLDWLHQRVGNHLRATLGHPVNFWFAIEEDKNCRVHLHGELVFNANDRTLVRKCLRKAGGCWRAPGPQFQLDLRPTPDIRYAGYALKDVRKTSRSWRSLMQGYGNPRSWVVTFEGKALTATHPVKRVAETIYNEARTLVL